MRRTSFSQNNLFETCPRTWYYQYILKVPSVSDMCYADRGTVVHKSLEKYYSKKENSIEEIKEFFNLSWDKYKLDDTKLKTKKDESWLMVINGIRLDLDVTSTEFKIYYEDAVGYIDVINTIKGEIFDWKSSTRSKFNEEEYTKQLKYYAWLYYRKFNKLPTTSGVKYLKYTGTKQALDITPTMENIKEMEDWNNGIREKMDYYVSHPYEVPRFNTEYFFSPYKHLFNGKSKIESKKETGELKYTLYIKGNTLQLDGHIPELLEKGLTKKFSYELKNAHWIKKHNHNINTTVKFWKSSKQILPLGFLDGLKKTLNDYAEYKKQTLKLKVIDERKFDETKVKMPNEFLNGIKLRDYQTEAVNTFLNNKIAVLELATGAGKTEISIEIIRKLGIKTLFVVNKIELMKQTKKRIEDALGIEIGQIGQGINNIKDITVATVQTLTKNISTFSKYLQTIQFCIMDEAHAVPSKSYWLLSNHLLNTRYRLLMTATPWRDDGNDMFIEAIGGKVCYKLDSKTLINNGWLIKPNIIFIGDYMNKNIADNLEKECLTGLINETPNYYNFYKGFISENVIRNNIISNIVSKNYGKKILILTKFVEHGELLTAQIVGSDFIYGNTEKNKRDEIFSNFKSGKINVLVGSMQIFSEGLDIPDLDIVINASANKGDIKSVQSLGRVIRKIKGKKSAMYYDFIDENKFFKSASYARKKKFLQEGHTVEVIKLKNA